MVNEREWMNLGIADLLAVAQQRQELRDLAATASLQSPYDLTRIKGHDDDNDDDDDLRH